jgi:hypothetical protein
MNERDLLNRLAELPREIPPRNDPWERIAARLDEQAASTGGPARRRRRPFAAWPVRAVAAVAVLAIALSLLPRPGTGPGTGPEQATAPVDTMASVAPARLLGSEVEYQAAFREFIAVRDARERIPAQTVEMIETGWADLRQVELALADALAQNPDDPFLNRRMLELRARQLGFLRQLAALDHSNRRLTI